MSYRTTRGVLRALATPRYYRAAWNIVRTFEHPVDVLRRYLTFAASGYPRTLAVTTPLGKQMFQVHSPDDLVTAVEVFARLDYRADESITCAVDLGSNIGISALYFLTRNKGTRVYLFEPMPDNVERLETNLAAFRDRYELHAVAIGDRNGRAEFCHEPTGRYGGINLVDLPGRIDVDVVDANEALRDVATREGTIDVLKVDIEGMETTVLNHLAPDVLATIGHIFVEVVGGGPDLEGFDRRQHGPMTQYRSNR